MLVRPIYGVVLDNLSKPAKSNPEKNIGQVLIDGSYTSADLFDICDSSKFPPNNFNNLNLPEGVYTSNEAMGEFVRMLAPYLSDQDLYQLTHELTRIECHFEDTQAFRTSKLIKPFLCCELERHAATTLANELPAVFLMHFQAYVIPLCEKNWPGKIASNINTFASFNIISSGGNNNFLCQATVEKLSTQDYHAKIMQFDAASFQPELLSTATEKDKNAFQNELALLRANYQGPLQPLPNAVIVPAAVIAAHPGLLEEDILISSPSGFAERQPTEREILRLRDDLTNWKNERERLSNLHTELSNAYLKEIEAGNLAASTQVKDNIVKIETRMRKLDAAIEPAERKLQQVPDKQNDGANSNVSTYSQKK